MTNYAVVRSLSVAMLNHSQLEDLHLKENQISRCLAPFEIEALFGLGSIREYWSIPDEISKISKHNTRIANELHSSGCYLDVEGSLSVLDYERCHIFDQNVMAAKTKSQIDFTYKGAGSSKTIIKELTGPGKSIGLL